MSEDRKVEEGGEKRQGKREGKEIERRVNKLLDKEKTRVKKGKKIV